MNNKMINILDKLAFSIITSGLLFVLIINLINLK